MINKQYRRNVKNFGKNLLKFRTQINMTRAELADLINLESERIIYDYENGEKFPSFPRIVLIADALNVSLDSLVSY